MKNESPKGTGAFRYNFVMVARIGIGDTAAARRHAVEAAFVKRLKKDEKGTRPRHLLHINQLLAAAKLAGGNEVLHSCHHHRADCKWLGHTGAFRGPTDFHDLSLDLGETGLQGLITGSLGDQDAGWTHQGIDDVADPQRELLHPSVHPGTDHRLVQLDLTLSKFGLGGSFLRPPRR